MDKRINIVLLCMGLLIAVSCKGLKVGVGLKGAMAGDDLMTLDGDTFRISERIGDSLVVIWNYPEEGESCYLIKLERDGLYYMQKKAQSIYSIENTSRFICLDEKVIYDSAKKSSFPVSCEASGLYYLGQWKDLFVFTDQDTICFSDGRCVILTDGVYCKENAPDMKVCLAMGAQTLNVSFKDLYQSTRLDEEKDNSIDKFTKNYYIQSKYIYGNAKAGFGVDLDIPQGDSNADRAIREWMVASIKDDAFSLLGYQKEIPVGNSGTVQEMKASLDSYGRLWEKLCRYDYQTADTLFVSLTCDVRIRKIVDCEDYTTYYYWASLYEGGLHDLPRSYYITYDRHLQTFLTASNTIKPLMMNFFRKEALKYMKPKYDEGFEESLTWENYKQSVFSFHCCMVDTDNMDELMRSFLVHQYTCDEWSGWGCPSDSAFTMDDFPLPHFALLPEGIVLTYHPYQIDCFAAGEYHVVIPFDSITHCLWHKYHAYPQIVPTLKQFIKCIYWKSFRKYEEV